MISVTSAIHGLLLWSEYAILYHVSNLIATQSELVIVFQGGFMSQYTCSGKTFLAKEDLKALGLRWDGQKKCWAGELPDDKLDKLKELAMQFSFNVSKNGMIVFGDER